MLGTNGVTASVTHIGDTNKIRICPFYAGNYRGGSSMVSLYSVDIKKVPRKQRTAYIATIYRLILYAQLIYGFPQGL